MESITHKTKAGEKEFVLSNTNKLLKTNQYVKGLKTGSHLKSKILCVNGGRKGWRSVNCRGYGCT